MSEIHGGNEELRNEGHPARPDPHETDAATRLIPQKDPRASLRIITKTLSISAETGRTMMSRVGYTLKI
jgi:hypothetical protein